MLAKLVIILTRGEDETIVFGFLYSVTNTEYGPANVKKSPKAVIWLWDYCVLFNTMWSSLLDCGIIQNYILNHYRLVVTSYNRIIGCFVGRFKHKLLCKNLKLRFVSRNKRSMYTFNLFSLFLNHFHNETFEYLQHLYIHSNKIQNMCLVRYLPFYTILYNTTKERMIRLHCFQSILNKWMKLYCKKHIYATVC